MQTSIVFGRIRRLPRLNSRPRSSTSYLPQGTACLEERLLLSGTVPAVSRTALAVRTVLAQGPTAVPSIVKAQPDQDRLSEHHLHRCRRAARTTGCLCPERIPPTGGWPVIVAIHGGGWRRLDKSGYGPRIASAFVPNGYVVVAPDYPLSSPGNPTCPINIEDLQTAVRWVRLNAGTFHIDACRIVAMGESAGANLADLLGTGSAFAGQRVQRTPRRLRPWSVFPLRPTSPHFTPPVPRQEKPWFNSWAGHQRPCLATTWRPRRWTR